MTYQIYNPKQIPPKDGGEFLTTAAYITKEEAKIGIDACIEAAKETCRQKGWDYSEMVHKNNLKIV